MIAAPACRCSVQQRAPEARSQKAISFSRYSNPRRPPRSPFKVRWFEGAKGDMSRPNVASIRAPMTNLVHHKRLRIEWGHCDPAGIVFNSRFFEYFDWSTWEMFETVLGVPRQDLFTTYDIIGVPLVDAQARFHVPVKFGDHVAVASEIGEF